MSNIRQHKGPSIAERAERIVELSNIIKGLSDERRSYYQNVTYPDTLKVNKWNVDLPQFPPPGVQSELARLEHKEREAKREMMSILASICHSLDMVPEWAAFTMAIGILREGWYE